jgi:hypothetical protein
VFRRLRNWLTTSRPYRDREYGYPDLAGATGMPWLSRLRMFFTGTGAVEHREDIRGRWLLHRKILMVVVALLIAWFIARSSAGWGFFDGDAPLVTETPKAATTNPVKVEPKTPVKPAATKPVRR